MSDVEWDGIPNCSCCCDAVFSNIINLMMMMMMMITAPRREIGYVILLHVSNSTRY